MWLGSVAASCGADVPTILTPLPPALLPASEAQNAFGAIRVSLGPVRAVFLGTLCGSHRILHTPVHQFLSEALAARSRSHHALLLMVHASSPGLLCLWALCQREYISSKDSAQFSFKM